MQRSCSYETRPAFAFVFVLGTALLLAGAADGSAAEGAEPAPIGPAELLARHGGALVTAEFVAHVETTGGRGALFGAEEEFAAEATCLMVLARGVAVCSNTQLGGYTHLMRRFLGSTGRGLHLDVSTVDLAVLLPSGERFEAELLATNSDLDLAWLEVVQPDDREFGFVDLEAAAEPALGDRIWMIRRMESHFDRAPMVHQSQVGAIVELPRRLYVPTIQLEAAYGMPVFSEGGGFVGLTVLQLPETEAETLPGGTLGMMLRSTRLRSLSRPVILPAATVLRATESILSSPVAADQPAP